MFSTTTHAYHVRNEYGYLVQLVVDFIEFDHRHRGRGVLDIHDVLSEITVLSLTHVICTVRCFGRELYHVLQILVFGYFIVIQFVVVNLKPNSISVRFIFRIPRTSKTTLKRSEIRSAFIPKVS